MKTLKNKLNLFLLILCATTTWAQTIRRVNNSGIALSANMYATLQEAVNAAVDGDIIYVEGSGKTYATATIAKKLTFIGPGYLLGNNYPYFADLRPADFAQNDIIFNAGSEGSTIIGFSNIDLYINISNITVNRNYKVRVYIGSSIASTTGVLINKNYLLEVINNGGTNGINVTITNNYVVNTYDLIASKFSGTFSNNIVNGSFQLSNFSVSNTILYSNSYNIFTNCSFTNNIDASPLASDLTNTSVFGTANGNKGSVDRTKLFLGIDGNGKIDFDYYSTANVDSQWKLKTGSVAISTGYNGTDCGIFGGTDPYELSGISAKDYPTITKFTTSGSGSNTTPLSVTISTKSN